MACFSTHSVTTMASLSRTGPILVRQSNAVPTPSVCSPRKVIDSASAIHSVWLSIRRTYSHTASKGASMVVETRILATRTV